MKSLIFILLIAVPITIFAQEKKLSDVAELYSYAQFRGTSNFDDNTSFSLRRFKLWAKSVPEFSKKWSYKVQATFSSFMQEKFFLQDVKVTYRTNLFSFDMGQFVPAFSLQRFQPDYKIPAIERAKVINVLIPDGTLGVRDIGFQVSFETKNKFFKTHSGIFNGYGIKEYHFNNKGYMLVHKSEFNITALKYKIKAGYSLQYRYATDLQLHFIFPDTVKYTGTDLRYNLFALFSSKVFEFQTEYLAADFNRQKANGYYILSAINIKKNQIVLSFEDYNDLIHETSDKPYCRIGYNYKVKEDKIKLSLDNYFQIEDSHIKKYFASIQLQIFLI